MEDREVKQIVKCLPMVTTGDPSHMFKEATISSLAGLLLNIVIDDHR